MSPLSLPTSDRCPDRLRSARSSYWARAAGSFIASLGGIIVTGTLIYTVALIIRNTTQGKPFNGWRIAHEIGAVLGRCPSTWGLVVPLLAMSSRIPPIEPIVIPLAVGVLAINYSLTVVSGVLAAATIISDATIKGWGFPSNAIEAS